MSMLPRRLGSDDWETWREARLAALSESPQAFGSSFAKESAYDEAAWRDWLRPERGLKAVIAGGDATAGVVGAWLPEDRGGAVELYSMWVAPSWRGQGFADLLVTEVLAWAGEEGHERVELWVVEGNRAAEKLYERHGFRATDERQPHPAYPEVYERIMVR